MTQIRALPPLRRRSKGRPTRPILPTMWDAGSAEPIEIVSPDRYSTALLLEYASALFPAEIAATESSWVVRLQPPTGGAWVLDFLALLERWLESVPLPCANVWYGGRSYLVRTSAGRAPAATPAGSPVANASRNGAS